MTAKNTITLVCDGSQGKFCICSVEVPSKFDTVKEARAYSKRNGWHVYHTEEGKRDLCAGCQ
jgi:hypothetical protein